MHSESWCMEETKVRAKVISQSQGSVADKETCDRMCYKSMVQKNRIEANSPNFRT
jgi:hypothetical protein